MCIADLQDKSTSEREGEKYLSILASRHSFILIALMSKEKDELCGSTGANKRRHIAATNCIQGLEID